VKLRKAREVIKVEEGVKRSPTFHDLNLIITDFTKGIDFDAAPTVQVSSSLIYLIQILRVQTESDGISDTQH
jgi:hypothetical protein